MVAKGLARSAAAVQSVLCRECRKWLLATTDERRVDIDTACTSAHAGVHFAEDATSKGENQAEAFQRFKRSVVCR